MDMEIMKRFITRLGRWEYACLCLLLVVNLAVHFSIINHPPSLVGDEQHYVTDAKVILEEHTTNRVEHPPLGKLLIAANIVLFGDNPIGWRLFPIIFGTTNIALLYLICRRLQMSRKAANIAAFLLTFENLSFVQGSIAMLDVFSLTFMLLSFWLYLKRSYPLSAVSVALATLTKLSGGFAILVILLHWLIVRRDRWRHFVAAAAIAPLSFLILMQALEFAIYHHLTNLSHSIGVMLSQSAILKFSNVSHPSLIRPWELLVIPKVMPYAYAPHYFGATSFTLWALIIPAFLYMIFKAIIKKNEAGLFGAAWFASAYLIWIPINLITDRVTYPYYIYPAVGAICIGLGLGLSQMVEFWQTRQTGKLRRVAIVGVVLFLLLHLGVFVLLAPVNPWPVERLLTPFPVDQNYNSWQY
jgi:dolichyl-phosphate-mannose-protein mannosyltransferase